MPGPHPSHSRDPPGVLSRNTPTRHNPEPGMLAQAVDGGRSGAIGDGQREVRHELVKDRADGAR